MKFIRTFAIFAVVFLLSRHMVDQTFDSGWFFGIIACCIDDIIRTFDKKEGD